MNTTSDGPSPIVLAPGAGEQFNILGEGIRVLAGERATRGTCFVFVSTTQPGAGPPLHRHGVDDEYFYVLEGTYRFLVDGRDHDVGPGTFVLAPRGIAHTFVNTGPTPAKMLVVSVPPVLEGAFRECDRARLTPADGARVAELFGKVGLTIEGPPIG